MNVRLTCLVILSFIFFGAIAMCAELPASENLHVYLLAGGKNMAGRAALGGEDGEIIERCYLLNADGTWEPARAPLNRYSTIRNEKVTQGLGPANSFVESMLAADKNISIGLVLNAGEGKTNFIEHWRYKDNCYRESRRRVKEARKHGTLKGVLWHQDNNRIDSSLSYLKDLIGNIRVDQGLLDLPFIVGGVVGGSSPAYDSKYRALIQDVHATGYASADGIAKLDVTGVTALGRRYAEEMLRVQKEQAAKPTPSIGPSMKVIDAHVHAQETTAGGLDVVAKWMELNGVERCISKPLTPTRPQTKEERAVMLANFRKYRGKIYRFCIIEPDEVSTVEEAVEILKREKAEGAIGFGEHYGRDRMFDDPSNLRLFAACEQVGLPVHFHIDNNKNMDELGLPRLELVLKKFPKLKSPKKYKPVLCLPFLLRNG